MFEVEKKFILQPDERERLIQGAKFLGEKKIIDVYYDTADYTLTKKDLWLRTRGGNFELKFPVGAMHRDRDITSYDEIEDDALIGRKLGISEHEPLDKSLSSLGYRPFATIVAVRSKYEKDGFHIDVDETDFDYAVLEIELMVANEDEMSSAGQRIIDFALARGISVPSGIPVRGKVMEYMRRNDSAHFNALEEAWGMKL